MLRPIPNYVVLMVCLTWFLVPICHAQTEFSSGGLGLSDAQWKEKFGQPTGFGRLAWSYKAGRYYTYSWARKEAPSAPNWKGYFPEDYYVKYIEIVWGENSKSVSIQKARAIVRTLIPPDSHSIGKASRVKNRDSQIYFSKSFANRIFPALAGERDCITPWGFGVGRFRIDYFIVAGKVLRAVIDVGDPYEAPLSVCK